ncbi:MAG: hypothetical protein GXP35_16405 [Actinobacteria bacterium]|nr:hypothetical protein [Actinomycetota bacterium]
MSAISDSSGGDFIEIDRGETAWRFEREFLQSNWTCIFGQGCKGILAGEAVELNQGCCSLGAHFGDGPTGEGEAMTVAAYATMLSPEQFEYYEAARETNQSERSEAEPVNIFGDADRTHTRVIDGACIFLNRPGFAGGEGCALHIAAVEADESPIDWKPSVCWQLPLRVDWQEVDDATETATVRRWTRDDWGTHGEKMAWCCTENSEGAEAYVGTEKVIDSMADSLTALAGEAVYVELRSRLR